MNNAGEELYPFLTLAGLQATRKVVHLVSFCLQTYVIFLSSTELKESQCQFIT